MKIIKDQDTKEFTFIYEHYQKQNNNIRYIKPSDNDGWHYYEVGSTVNNIITIINHLFGYSFSNFDDFITTFKLECDYKKDKKSPWLKYDKTQISDNHIFIKMKMPNNCVCIIEVKGKHTELEFKQKEQTFDCADVIHKNFTIHKKPTTTSLLTLQLFPINLDEKLLDIKPDYLTYCCMCQALNDTSKLVETLKILALYIEKQPKTTSLLLSYHLNLINALIRHNDPDITASVILDLIGYSWTKNLPQLKAIINQELEKEIFSGIQICKLLTTLVDKNWDLDFIKLIAKGQQEMLSKSLAKSDLIGQSVLYKEIIKIDKDFTNKKMFEFNTNTVFKEDLGITDNLTDSDKDKILALHSTIEEQEKETIIKKLMKVCNKITKHEADEFIKLKNINPKLREQPELIKINAATQILLIHDSAIKDKALQIIKTNESFSNDEQIDKKAILKKQFDLHDDQAEKIISIINDSTASRNQIHKKLFSILKINSRLSKNEVKNVAIIIGDHKEWIDEKIMNLKMESNYDCIQIYEILKRVKYVSIWDEQWLNKLKNKYYTLLTTTEDDEEEELGANNLFGDDDSDDDDIDDEA